MTNYQKVDRYIVQWEGVSKLELRARLKSLKTKLKTDDVQAEIKAINYLLQ